MNELLEALSYEGSALGRMAAALPGPILADWQNEFSSLARRGHSGPQRWHALLQRGSCTRPLLYLWKYFPDMIRTFVISKAPQERPWTEPHPIPEERKMWPSKPGPAVFAWNAKRQGKKERKAISV